MKVSEITDVYVRIECDLLVVGDSIITDRHTASNGNYNADDPQNQIGGLIPAYPLSGWLRHGMEAVVQDRGATACHPGEASANFKKGDVYDRDLDAGDSFALRIAPTDDRDGRPFARLGSRPWRSWASTWSRLTAHPLDTADDEWEQTLDANLRRLWSWSTALQYIEDFQNWGDRP